MLLVGCVAKATVSALAPLRLKLVLMPEVNPGELADNVTVPLPLGVTLLKVARPVLSVLTVSDPVRAALPEATPRVTAR